MLQKSIIVKKNRRVCCQPSARSRYDAHIFLKMCIALVNNGDDTKSIVADRKSAEKLSRVCIFNVGQPKRHLRRDLSVPILMSRQAITFDADRYHPHHPELIPIGLKLKRLVKAVILASHEDVPKQLLMKPYLSLLLLRVLSFSSAVFERLAYSPLDSIVSAKALLKPVSYRSLNISRLM